MRHHHGRLVPLLKGGQGRTCREIEENAAAIGRVVVLTFVLICLAVAATYGGTR